MRNLSEFLNESTEVNEVLGIGASLGLALAACIAGPIGLMTLANIGLDKAMKNEKKAIDEILRNASSEDKKKINNFLKHRDEIGFRNRPNLEEAVRLLGKKRKFKEAKQYLLDAIRLGELDDIDIDKDKLDQNYAWLCRADLERFEEEDDLSYLDYDGSETEEEPEPKRKKDWEW